MHGGDEKSPILSDFVRSRIFMPLLDLAGSRMRVVVHWLTLDELSDYLKHQVHSVQALRERAPFQATSSERDCSSIREEIDRQIKVHDKKGSSEEVAHGVRRNKLLDAILSRVRWQG